MLAEHELADLFLAKRLTVLTSGPDWETACRVAID